jgi:hypothetical protein
MASAGYSGTPLPQKLGIKEMHKVAVLAAPHGFALGVLPMGTRLVHNLSGRGAFDVLLVFVTRRADLVARIASCRPRMQQAAGLWIAWPKRASKVATDITEDTVREVALPTGLVDNKVCAIDDIWSGLRLVIRKELRDAAARTSPTDTRNR